jgi:hypothetical protein
MHFVLKFCSIHHRFCPSCWQHCCTPVLPVQCCSGSLVFSSCHCNICEAYTFGVICLGKPQEPFTEFIITIVICYRHRQWFHISNGRCSSPLFQRSGVPFERVSYFMIDHFPLKRAGERDRSEETFPLYMAHFPTDS